jgi:hypothetical protein
MTIKCGTLECSNQVEVKEGEEKSWQICKTCKSSLPKNKNGFYSWKKRSKRSGKKGKNRKKIGYYYENKLIKKAYEEGGFGMRKYASLGIIDTMWVTKDGQVFLTQDKFGATPYISKQERERIQEFANRFKGVPNVWVGTFLKKRRQPEKREKYN